MFMRYNEGADEVWRSSTSPDSLGEDACNTAGTTQLILMGIISSGSGLSIANDDHSSGGGTAAAAATAAGGWP